MKKVMVFGTFDLIHFGHLKMLQQAKKLGNYLIVVIARDKNVEKIKKSRCFHTENERKEIMENIKLVDKVVFGSKKYVYKVILEQKPNIIALGYDQKMFVNNLEGYLEKESINSKIVRLKSFKEKRLKTHLIKKYGNKTSNCNNK
ncbi:MAG: FAD synthase [Candidatus Magasanikbacteria bacterium]|nr:FAD synthase [Candidatus Magasanikbacteria bacterium]